MGGGATPRGRKINPKASMVVLSRTRFLQFRGLPSPSTFDENPCVFRTTLRLHAFTNASKLVHQFDRNMSVLGDEFVRNDRGSLWCLIAGPCGENRSSGCRSGTTHACGCIAVVHPRLRNPNASFDNNQWVFIQKCFGCPLFEVIGTCRSLMKY